MKNKGLTMTKEDDSTQVQSSVRYNKFDNDENAESESDITSGMDKSAATNDLVESRQNGVPSSPAVDEAEESSATDETDNTDTSPRHEVVLQMNGAPSGGTGQSEPEPEWNWYNLVLSVCSIFCCTVCGILATVTSILAYVDHRVKDFDASRSKRLAAYALALTGLISGVICMVIVVVLALHYDNKL